MVATAITEPAFPAYMAKLIKSKTNAQLAFTGGKGRILSVTCKSNGNRYYLCKGVAGAPGLGTTKIYWFNAHYNPVSGAYVIPKPSF